MNTINQKGNIVEIEKPEGKYTVLYGVHILSQNPEEIPADTDAVILETGVVPYLEDPMQSFQHLREHVQYKKLIDYLEEKRIPVIFTDVKYKFNNLALLLLDSGTSAMKWSHGATLIKKQGSKTYQRIGELLIASWLVLPFVANAVRMVSVLTKRGLKQSADLKKLTHKLHPDADLLFLTVRNALIAEKNAFIMKHLSKQKKIVTVLGAAHVGIEDMQLLSDDSRDTLIRRLLPLLRRLVDPAYFYKAVQFNFSNGEWGIEKIIEVPQLKSMIA